MTNRLIQNRGTKEIPPEILARPDLYPHPEAYTYKVHILNGARHISIFPILSDEEIKRREKTFKNGVTEVLKKHPDTIKRIQQIENENRYYMDFK